MENNASAETQLNDEVSLKDILLKVKSQYRYLKAKWKLILLCTLLSGGLGLLYSIFIMPTYEAVVSFVLDDGKQGGMLSQYAGLASFAGINLDSDGGGLFQSDNIIQLYTSRSMIEKTLLTKEKFNDKEELLIDRYIEFNNLRNKWKNKERLTNINFNGDPNSFNRDQDSIINVISELFNKKNLSVFKPDKKTSIILVKFDSKDELFAKLFAETLVSNVNNFYVQTKTKKASDNLNVLEHQADSVKSILNSSIAGVALSTDATPNANPYNLILRVPSQKKQVDVQANSAIYAEVIKNLEIAKMSLMQAKPLIQLIDKPVLPLETDRIGEIKGIIIGLFAGVFFTVVALLILKFFKSAVN